jgi:hypothetical protein
MANFTVADLLDFVFHQDNKTESLDSDSDDDLDEDLIFEMDETDIVKNLNLQRKLKIIFSRVHKLVIF